MKESQSLRTPAASAAKVGMAAVLTAGMAIATPATAFATGEDQDVSVASENVSDSYYYIGDSSYGLSTYLSEAVAQGSTKIHVGTSFTDKGTVTIPSSITELSGYSEGWFSSGPKTVDFGYSYKMMRVYVSGTNLLTFSPFKYWDPEKGSGNGLSYPLQRTFNLGFQFNF